MKLYLGWRDRDGVTRVKILETDKGLRDLPKIAAVTLTGHDPPPFDWGNNWAGSTVLALSLLADLLGNVERAASLCFECRKRNIAHWQLDTWMVSEDTMMTWVKKAEEDF